MTKFFDIFSGEKIAFNLDIGRGMTARYEHDKRVAEANARAQAEAVAGCVMPSDGPTIGDKLQRRMHPIARAAAKDLLKRSEPQPDADGWIPHDGKGFPEAARAFEKIDFKRRNGTVSLGALVAGEDDGKEKDSNPGNLWNFDYPNDLDRTHWRPHVAADTWHPMSEEPGKAGVYEVRRPEYPETQFFKWFGNCWSGAFPDAKSAQHAKGVGAAIPVGGTGWREVQA